MDDQTQSATLDPIDSPPVIPIYDITIVQELNSLRRQMLALQQRIREIAGPAALVARIPVDCLRCGYKWIPYNPFVPPLKCARCGDANWNSPPTDASRKPSDPPLRTWRRRKGVRRPKFRVWTEASGSPFAPRIKGKVQQAIDVRELAPQSEAAAPPAYVPPSVRSALPPPPSPAPFIGSLRDQLFQIRVEQSMPEQQLEVAEDVPAPSESAPGPTPPEDDSNE